MFLERTIKLYFKYIFLLTFDNFVNDLLLFFKNILVKLKCLHYVLWIFNKIFIQNMILRSWLIRILKLIRCKYKNGLLYIMNIKFRKTLMSIKDVKFWQTLILIRITLSIRKDSFRKSRVVKSFRNRYIYIRLRGDSKQVWAAILSLNYLKLRISSLFALFLLRTHITLQSSLQAFLHKMFLLF